MLAIVRHIMNLLAAIFLCYLNPTSAMSTIGKMIIPTKDPASFEFDILLIQIRCCDRATVAQL